MPPACRSVARLAAAARDADMERAVLREGWLRARERLPTEIFLDSEDISRVVAAEIAALIRSRQAEGGCRGWQRHLRSTLAPCIRHTAHSHQPGGVHREPAWHVGLSATEPGRHPTSARVCWRHRSNLLQGGAACWAWPPAAPPCTSTVSWSGCTGELRACPPASRAQPHQGPPGSAACGRRSQSSRASREPSCRPWLSRPCRCRSPPSFCLPPACAAAVRCYRYCTATVLLVYRREEGLSFRNVLTFNLDEYHPMQPQALQAGARPCRTSCHWQWATAAAAGWQWW